LFTTTREQERGHKLNDVWHFRNWESIYLNQTIFITTDGYYYACYYIVSQSVRNMNVIMLTGLK
jgi:hypothetical protein